MIDMLTWAPRKVDVMKLRLDPRNVRLELADEAPESDIVNDLFVNEKAFSLVEGIVKVGLLTHEVPIVLKRDKHLYVVEGNRRIAALKAIQNPYLAPSHLARINKLLEGFTLRDSLRRIDVKEAPSQDDADQLIAALHTGNQRVAWSPSRQAAFFQAQLDGGRSVEELFSLYPTVDVKKFVARSQILNLFRNVDYADPTFKDFIRGRRFPVSTLARLYDNDKFLDLVGIQVNNADGTVQLNTGPIRFAKIAETIVSGITSKDPEVRLDTRTLNSTKSDTYRNLMDSLRDIMNEDVEEEPDSAEPIGTSPTDGTTSSFSGPGTQHSGTGQRSTGSKPEDSGAPPSEQSPQASTISSGESSETPSGAKPKRQSRYLETDEFTVAAAYPRAIHQIFGELSTLNVDKFPNATLDLIRTFLEKTIKAFAISKGEDIRASLNSGLGASAHAAGNAGGSGTVVRFVQLGECLLWLEKYFQSNGSTSLKQVVVKVRSGKVADYTSSVDHMNAINHNHDVFATPSDVRECWSVMQSILRAILA